MNEERPRLSTRDIADVSARRREREREGERERERDDRDPNRPSSANTPASVNTQPAPNAAAPAVNAPRDTPSAVNPPPTMSTADPSNAPPQGAVAADDARELALFPPEEAASYRSRWEDIQIGFVDQPKTAVEEADALVAQVVTRLAEVFSEERAAMERQWGKGDNVSTEDLRQTLKRYRSFFNRLLPS